MAPKDAEQDRTGQAPSDPEEAGDEMESFELSYGKEAQLVFDVPVFCPLYETFKCFGNKWMLDHSIIQTWHIPAMRGWVRNNAS